MKCLLELAEPNAMGELEKINLLKVAAFEIFFNRLPTYVFTLKQKIIS